MPPRPCGAKPPCPSRLLVPTGSEPGSRPSASSAPTTRNSTTTATLSDANQNSNSPKLRTGARLTTANAVTSSNAMAHCGSTGSHPWMICEAPVISTPSTSTSVAQ